MKKFLFALLTGLLIASILCGCDTTPPEIPAEARTDTSTEAPTEEFTADIEKRLPDTYEEITSIEAYRGDGLKMSITDGETIEKIYNLIDAVKGDALGSTKGYYGWLHALTIYADGSGWSFVVTGNQHYSYNDTRFETVGNEILEFIDIVDQAYIDNRVYEEPLKCTIPTTSVGIDVYISSSDAEKILTVFNEAEWTLQNTYIYDRDYIFLVQSGAEIYYDKENGKMYDRKNECYFYLSDKDKAFIDEVLQKGE